MTAVKNHLPDSVMIRNVLHPGDMGAIVSLHGRLYAEAYGFDTTFEAYVAEPLSRFVLSRDAGQRIWVVERQGRIEGSLAIVRHSEDTAQLRWFLLHPRLRGQGLGKELARQALKFCRASGYRRVFLWTIKGLAAAAAVYQSLGFRLEASKPSFLWGDNRVEERYGLDWE